MDVFTRNVQYMTSQVAGEHAARTFQMLQATFPGLRNFDQLRTFRPALRLHRTEAVAVPAVALRG